MNGSSHIHAAIKHQLKARNLRYADLARALEISEASVKRLLSRGGITLERLDAICEFIGIDVYELVRSGRQADAAKSRQLTTAQEQALAEDARLLLVFHLLCNDWDTPAIRKEFGLSEPDIVLLLARLDRLGLIELLPGNRVRLKVQRDFSWRTDGPVLRRHGRSAMIEFLRGDFSGDGSLLRLDIKELSPASIALLQQRLARVGAEFGELAETDAALPGSGRRGVGLVLAMRPWVFSLLESLRADGDLAAGGKQRRKHDATTPSRNSASAAGLPRKRQDR